MSIAGVAVGGEVTDTLELQVSQRLHRGSEGLHIAVLHNVQRIRIDDLFHGGDSIAVLLFTDGGHIITGILHLPETVIKTYLSLHSMCTTDPMERLTLDLTVGTGQTTA